MTATVLYMLDFKQRRELAAAPAPAKPEPAPEPARESLALSIAEMALELERQSKANKPFPAYCDPNNETRGSKFDKNLRTVEIAKLVRKDIAEAIKAGKLPKIKTSIRSDHRSISIRIVEVPGDFVLYDEEHIRAQARNEYQPGSSYTEGASALLKAIEAIADEYNRDNSDMMVDYFDKHFYLTVQYDHDIGQEQYAAVTADERQKMAKDRP